MTSATTTDAITGKKLRELFLDYFRAQGHAILPSASLIPENDPTVLFTTAGMHPLIPYLQGEPHPLGTRLANVQKCLRTGDLEEVGDASHLTFFEMLGNWSLGDYFKAEAIAMSFEFLTSDRWLGIPIERLAVTCFSGDDAVPRDEESARLWQHAGIPRERIFFFGRAENWWGPPGSAGPCGPDTEMFFDTGRGSSDARPNDASGRYVEIWNDVFMEYEKTAEGTFRELPKKNVDTGMGLERAVAALNDRQSVFETDLFTPLVTMLRSAVRTADDRNLRITADHLRAAHVVLADPRGVIPSNVEQGYVLRRLLRRGIRALKLMDADDARVGHILERAADVIAEMFHDPYPEVSDRKPHVVQQFRSELQKYVAVERRAQELVGKWREAGTRTVTGGAAFAIYQETGIHPDLLRSLGTGAGIGVDLAGFDEQRAKHQEASRAGMSQRFSGGLADHSERTVRMHTATHLLHESLRRVLGTHVMQRGSNITPDRLRFDFSHPRPVRPEELRTVEDLVNLQVTRNLPVVRRTMSPEEAKAAGALGFFEEKYGDVVNVYSVGDFSKEICGGPHVEKSGDIGTFRILKEEGLQAGVRRIRATVE